MSTEYEEQDIFDRDWPGIVHELETKSTFTDLKKHLVQANPQNGFHRVMSDDPLDYQPNDDWTSGRDTNDWPYSAPVPQNPIILNHMNPGLQHFHHSSNNASNELESPSPPVHRDPKLERNKLAVRKSRTKAQQRLEAQIRDIEALFSRIDDVLRLIHHQQASVNITKSMAEVLHRRFAFLRKRHAEATVSRTGQGVGPYHDAEESPIEVPITKLGRPKKPTVPLEQLSPDAKKKQKNRQCKRRKADQQKHMLGYNDKTIELLNQLLTDCEPLTPR